MKKFKTRLGFWKESKNKEGGSSVQVEVSVVSGRTRWEACEMYTCVAGRLWQSWAPKEGTGKTKQRSKL